MKTKDIEYIGDEFYLKIDESFDEIEKFLKIVMDENSPGYSKDMEKKDFEIAYRNLTNHMLLRTNVSMLNDELFGSYPSPKLNSKLEFEKDFSRIVHDPEKIVLLGESYLNKLGSIGTLTLEQIGCTLIGEYDPFNPRRKVSFNKIKETIDAYSSPDLKKSFLEGFCGIFDEVKDLRNKADHSNLVMELLMKEDFKPGSWDSEREKKELLFRKFDNKKHYGIFRGDLVIKSKNGEGSLTDKLQDYGTKYLEMVKDTYKGLNEYLSTYFGRPQIVSK